MEDWCQVKVGIFCRELVSGQGRLPTVKDWCQVMVQWTSEDRCQIMVGDLARRIGVRPTYVLLCVDWCQVKVRVPLQWTGFFRSR